MLLSKSSVTYVSRNRHQKQFSGGGLPMVGFQEIGVYNRPQLGLPYRFVEFGHDYRYFYTFECIVNLISASS
jgi:hypothetical protein